MLQHRQEGRARPGFAISAGIPLLAAGLAMAFNAAAPLASPLFVALVLGSVLANSPFSCNRAMQHQDAVAKILLRIGVILLGLRLPLSDLAAVGLPGVVIIVVTVAFTFWVTCTLGDRLGLDRGLVTLIATGFAICGASAIAAVENTVARRKEDVALSIALVTMCGTAMIAILPLMRAPLGLSDAQFGIWAGASIHEVAQVVAAAAFAGPLAVALAMTIKLGRVALLAPAYLTARWRMQNHAQPHNNTPPVPWFVGGFILCVGVRSFLDLPTQMLSAADMTTSLFLAAAMFGLGLGMRLKDLLPVPWRVLWLAICSTLTALCASLAMTLAML